ncbi:DMT family transporter [candidate division WWE3 bacterium]|uniref:DMT family transporter n=1 Tax=candidate division WWE3 bacterium TaxID=2053526 RepID=A0A955ECW0_UNCKA|nr:DMT family transporter [candidate division WWE3 bacterium]
MLDSRTLKGYSLILLAAVGFGSYGVWARYIGGDFGVYYHAWIRSVMVLLIILPVGYFTKQFKRVDAVDLKWLLVPVFCGIFTQAPIYYAFNNMDIGTATLLFFAMFLITSYVIGSALFGEKLTHIKVFSLIVGLLGLVLVFGISLGKFSLLAIMLASLTGIASGGEVVFSKKTSSKYSSLQINLYVWLGILITHLPTSLLVGETQLVPQFNFIWFSMLAYSVVGLLSFWLVIEGFKTVDASIGSLIGLMEVVFGVLFGVVLFGESLTSTFLLGGLLILVAGMLPDLYELLKVRYKH